MSVATRVNHPSFLPWRRHKTDPDKGTRSVKACFALPCHCESRCTASNRCLAACRISLAVDQSPPIAPLNLAIRCPLRLAAQFCADVWVSEVGFLWIVALGGLDESVALALGLVDGRGLGRCELRQERCWLWHWDVCQERVSEIYWFESFVGVWRGLGYAGLALGSNVRGGGGGVVGGEASMVVASRWAACEGEDGVGEAAG